MTRILAILFCISATAAICQAQSTLYFPQIAEGLQAGGIDWGMIIAITNSSAMTANCTLTLMKEDGAPFLVTFKQTGAGGVGFQPPPNSSQFPFQLTPGQTTLFISPGESGQSTTALQTGFAIVNSSVAVSGTVIFSEFGPGGRIAQAGVPSATPLMTQEIIAMAPGPSSDTTFYPPNTATSAIAIANPGNTFANVTFALVDGNGQASATPIARRMAPHSHIALFVNQLFPNAIIGGTMRFASDAPLVATALLFQNNGQFATFPVFSLQ